MKITWLLIVALFLCGLPNQALPVSQRQVTNIVETKHGRYAVIETDNMALLVRPGIRLWSDKSLVVAVQPKSVLLRSADGKTLTLPLIVRQAALAAPSEKFETVDTQAQRLSEAIDNPYHSNTPEMLRLIHVAPALLHTLYQGRLPLEKAVEADRIEAVALLLNHGADVNTRDSNGQTALYPAVASQYVDREMIRLMLDRGADVHAVNQSGETPLLFACRFRGNEAVVEMLLTHGADPNSRDKNGNTPLHLAIAQSQFDIAEQLIQNGAKLNVKNQKGDLPIHLAMRLPLSDQIPGLPYSVITQTQAEQIEARLVFDKARLDIPDRFGLTPFWYGMLNHNASAISLLLPHLTKRDHLATLFAAAAMDNLPTLSRGLAANTALAEMRGPRGVSLLHLAALWDRPQAAAFLLAHGADSNARDADGRTPLHDACLGSGSEAVIRLLLAQGAHLDTEDSQSATPLALAVRQRRLDIVRLMLAAGAAPSVYVPTANLQAAFRNRTAYEIMRSLLEAGGDPNQMGTGTENLLHLAIQANNAEFVQLLLDHGAKANLLPAETDADPLLMQAIPWGNLRIVHMLLDHGADITLRDRSGRTVLMAAAQDRQSKIGLLLLDYGAEAAAKDDNGNTAVTYALLPRQYPNDPWKISEVYVKFIKRLLEKGADANGTDYVGNTPLLYATAGELDAPRAAIIKDLIAHGADVHAIDRQGNTALIHIIWNQLPRTPNSISTELLQRLLSHGADINVTSQVRATLLNQLGPPLPEESPAWASLRRSLANTNTPK